MTIQTLGIDLGKTLCSLAGLDAAGRVVLRKRIRRDKIESREDGQRIVAEVVLDDIVKSVILVLPTNGGHLTRRFHRLEP